MCVVLLASQLFNNEFMTAASDVPTGPAGMGPRAKDTIGPEVHRPSVSSRPSPAATALLP
jgi:hypothetical protein